MIEVPAEQDPSPRSLGSEPLGFVTSFSFDASNEFVAFLQVNQGDEDRYELQVWSRRSHYLLEDVNVLSYQWHPDRTRLLAAVTIADPGAPAELQVLSFDESGQESHRTPITRLGQHHVLHGWGEWGFLIGHYDQLFETDVTTVLDAAGDVVWQADDMTVLDASHDHVVVHQHNEANENLYSVISPTDPSNATPLPLPDGVVGLTGFGWSPDERLAVLYPTEGRDSSLRIYNTSQTEFTDIPLEGWRIWDLKWGPNSRFVVMPGTDDAGRHVAIICDTSTQAFSYVDFSGWVQWADLS